MLSVLLCLTIAQSQNAGVYKPAGAEPAVWSVNQHHTLIWGGQPYVPMGLIVDGTREDIESAVAKGARDLIVRLPVSGGGWREIVALLESKKVNYLVEISSAAKPAKGVVVQPETYRRSGITEEGGVTFPLFGAESAYAVVVNARSSFVTKQDRFTAVDGKIKIPFETGGLEHVLLVYPETTSMAQPDYWDEFDSQRDDLLAAIQGAKFGPGLRGIIDPIGQAVSLFGEPKSFVPTSSAFRLELKTYLTDKYRNHETAVRAWGVRTNDFTSMDDLTKLVPLYTESRGVEVMWNPDKNIGYKFEARSSTAWGDIDTVIRAAAAKRYDRIVSAIRQVVDVPVIQQFKGWRGPYETSQPSLSGMGVRASGASSSALAESAAPGVSSLCRWSSPGWLIATSIDAPKLSDAAAELGAMGVRGFFARATPETLAELGSLSGDVTLAQWSPTPLFYPEAASNPAAPMRLPSGYYWLPSPMPGTRLEMGPFFAGYRYEVNGQPTTVIWGLQGAARVRMRFGDPKVASITFQTIDGSLPNPKIQKNAIEVSITQFPMVISGATEIPIPEPALIQTAARFERLSKLATSRQMDLMQEKFNFKNALAGFDRTPAANFASLRRQYWIATSRLADYTWIEAEASKSHIFSEIVAVPGANGGTALRLKSLGPIDPRGHFAEYVIPVRYLEDQEIWVSAMIPAEARNKVSIRIMGTDLVIQGDPVHRYSNGFTWYRFGITKLSGNNSRFQLVVNNDGPTEIVVDTLFVAPVGVTPSGPLPPEIVEDTGK